MEKPGRQTQWDKASKRKGNSAPLKTIGPFRTGETLNYRVAWSAFTAAATLQLSVPEQRNLYGWETWHFRSVAHTLNPVRTLFAIDDQFDSYSDATDLESRQYEMHLNEMGKKQDRTLHFVPIGQTSRAPGPDVVVLPGTLDPLGALYALREADWERTPEFRAPAYDGQNMYEMIARREAPRDEVTVAAGKFSASRLAVHLTQHGKEVSGVSFEIWLSNDAARIPVAIQAQLPFGNARAELVRAAP